MDLLLLAAEVVFAPAALAAVMAGSLLGVVFGAIPGHRVPYGAGPVRHKYG